MPAYLGVGATPEAALWDSATGSTNISDEVLFDLREAAGLVGASFRYLRQLALSLDEDNVSFEPAEIPSVVEEVDRLLSSEVAARADIAPSFRDELVRFRELLNEASQGGLCVTAHVEHHIHPADILTNKRDRLSKASP